MRPLASSCSSALGPRAADLPRQRNQAPSTAPPRRERIGAQRGYPGASSVSMRIARASSPPSACSSLAEAHEQRARRTAGARDLKRVAERDAVVGQVAQHLGVGVGDAHEAPGRPASSVVEAAVSASAISSSSVGIGSPWGSIVGSPSLRGDQLLELLGEHVLEDLSLGVHAIPAASPAPRRGTARAAGDGAAPPARPGGPRRSASRRGRARARRPDLGELAQHRRHRAGGDAQALGEVRRRRLHRLRPSSA